MALHLLSNLGQGVLKMAPDGGKKWDYLIINAHLATMVDNGEPYGAIRHGALAIADQRIAWLGPLNELPGAPENCANKVYAASGLWLTPGLIDCHTHLVFAGNRASEFEQRLNGVSYEEIARKGGGILSTVNATRSANEGDLVEKAAERMRHLRSQGVTRVEVKSGYGLTLESELRMLRAIRRLQERQPIDVSSTFLGAHAVPPEFKDDSDAYVDLVCNEMLPVIKEQGLADAVDAYCESIAFSTDQVRRVFETASKLGFDLKLHADQLTDCGGASLAAEFKALSADHLEYTGEAGVKAMAKAGTIAVMLPGAFHNLQDPQKPPIQSLREHAVPMAVATDCNPGSSPLSSIITAMNLACIHFKMTPEESLAGVTINAAKALGVDQQVGSLEVGKMADLALWDISEPAELAYWVGGRRCRRLYKDGQAVY
jgi:imidazolonepropionase